MVVRGAKVKAPAFAVPLPLMHHGLVLPRRGRATPAPVVEGGNDLLGLPRLAMIPSGFALADAEHTLDAQSAAASCAVRASLGRPCAVEAASFSPCSVPSRGSRRQLSPLPSTASAQQAQPA